ncbi:MAG TPA: hypothetical protein VF189_00705 [Patescibacteria group bacterium]
MKVFLGFLVVVIFLALVIPFLRFTPLQTPVVPTPFPTEKVAKVNPCRALEVKSPVPTQKISPPSINVVVVVDNSNPKCSWGVFEAQAGTVQLEDDAQNVLATGTLNTNEDWTAKKPVTYQTTIPFNGTTSTKLNLVITEENPSGSDNPQTVSIPLVFN